MIEEEPVTSAVTTGAVAGAAGLSVTFTVTEALAVVAPSLTVQVNVYVPDVEGVKVGVALEALSKPVAGDQLYV